MKTVSAAQSTVTNDDIALTKTIKFGIGKRLILAFGAVGLLSVLISFVSWNGLNSLSQTQSDITNKNVPAMTSALKLTNLTSQLVAFAPLLTSAQKEEDRENHMGQITRTLAAAKQEIATLSPLLHNEKDIKNLQDTLAALEPIFTRLNEIVQENQTLEAQRIELGKTLVGLRKIAEEKVAPLASNINIQLVDLNDKWLMLLDDVISQAQNGDTPNYDTNDLEMAPLDIARFQKAVLSFKSSANLLIGLLLEGSQSQDIKTIENIQQAFLLSITSMATPLTEISSGSDDELNKLFQQLLTMGSKGDQNTDILKLRTRQVQLSQEGEELLNQARDVSGKLSSNVTKTVASLQQEMNTAVSQSEKRSSTMQTTLLGVTAISVIVIVLVGWFYILGNLVKRLMKLVNGMQEIAKGDLTTRVNRNGTDEISLMGSALALLRNGLRETDQLKQQQEEEREKSQQRQKDQALKMAKDFDEAVGQSLAILSEQVGSIRQKANAMNDISKRTLSETQEVTSASQVMSNDITSVAENTEELAKSITEISSQVANSTQVAAEAVTRAANLNGNIEKLQSGSQKIESVIGLINNIAEQTNLLALNATIEASRAGEAGKGFAVVASEVKNLANQTAHAIDDIATLITDIQTEISQAVESNGQITNIIEEIDQLSTGIAAAVEQQSAATGEISRTVQSTAAHVNTISERVVDVSSAIQENNEMIGDVLGGVSEIDDQSTSLTNEVEHFLNDVRKSAR